MLNNKKIDIFAHVSAFIIVISLFIRQYKPAFTVAMIVFFLFAITDYYLQQRIRCFSLPLNLKKGMGAFFGAVMISAILSLDIVNIKESMNFISYALPFFMLAYLSSENNIKKSIKIALLTLIMVGSCKGGYEYFVLKEMRINALLQVATLWASFMGLVLPLFVYPIFKKDNRKQAVFYSFITLLIILSLYATKTRGMIAPCIFVIFLLAIYVGIKKNILVGITLATLGIVGISIILNNMYRGYEYQRVYGWIAATNMWLDHPLIGIGIERWQEAYISKQYFPAGATEHLMHAHNLYLCFLATTGLIGVSGMLYFFYNTFKEFITRVKTGDKYYYVGLCGLIIYLISSLLDSTMSIKYFTRIFWCMIFIYQYNIFEDS